MRPDAPRRTPASAMGTGSMSDAKSNGLTYAQAGVDIDAGNAMVDAIKPLVRATRRPGADAEIGGFGGLFDLKAAGFKDPILVAANDGVGTKVKIAIETGVHDTIGIDLVAMCVNDIIVQGAEPLLFLDYFATGQARARRSESPSSRASPKAAAAPAARSSAARRRRCPASTHADDYDLAGFAVGAAERGTLLPRAVAAGDVLIGLPSSGLHSNGFSLVRRIVAYAGLRLGRPQRRSRPARRSARRLLEPTRIYVRPVLAALKANAGIKALAHITGGGFPDNIPRVLPDGVGGPARPCAQFPSRRFSAGLPRPGGVAEAEMLRTFNCGIGMVAVAAPDRVDAVIAEPARGRRGAGPHRRNRST